MKRLGQTITLLVLLAVSLTVVREAQAGFPDPGAPRTCNYYLRQDPAEHTFLLSKWDALIIGYEFINEVPDLFDDLRRFNPDQKILVYMDPMVVTDYPEGQPGDLEYDFATGVDSLWYAYNEWGEVISYWGSTIHVNVTEHCPEIGGQQYREYFIEFVRDRIYPYMEDGTIDGIFLDEMSGGGYTWWDPLFDGSFDYNRDGFVDPPDSVQAWLIDAMEFFADSTTYEKPADSYIIGNNCKPRHASLDGKFYEAFPAFWEGYLEGSLHDLDVWNSLAGADNFTTVNGLYPTDDMHHFRHIYTASLLSDNYFSFSHTTNDHYQLTWYDLFDFELGLPLGPRYLVNEDPLVTEDFERGLSGFIRPTEFATGTFVTDPVIQGNISYLIESDSEYQYPLLAKLDIPGGWQANSWYTISFQYRSLAQEFEEGRLFFKSWSTTGNPDAIVTSGDIKLNEGAEGLFRVSFQLEDFNDYEVFLRSEWDLDLLIDSLTVVEGRGGLWTREYENGRVFCNESGENQLIPFRADWGLADGDMQHEHYPSWQINLPVSLAYQDGLVFMNRDPVSAPEQAAPAALYMSDPWPNPGNPAFNVTLVGREGVSSELTLHDIRGRRLAELWKGDMPVDGLNLHYRAGQGPMPELPSGVYFLRARSGERVETKRWVLLR